MKELIITTIINVNEIKTANNKSFLVKKVDKEYKIRNLTFILKNINNVTIIGISSLLEEIQIHIENKEIIKKILNLIKMINKKERKKIEKFFIKIEEKELEIVIRLNNGIKKILKISFFKPIINYEKYIEGNNEIIIDENNSIKEVKIKEETVNNSIENYYNKLNL